MKAGKFTDAQKSFILKQGYDGMLVADICRKARISQAPYITYDDLLSDEIRRLKLLEDKNSNLRKVVDNLSLDKAMPREDLRIATQPKETWAMDFVHDQLTVGRKIRILTVVDTFSRYAPVIDPRFSYRAEDVVATLERVCAQAGYPSTIRVDNVLCRKGNEGTGQEISNHEIAPAGDKIQYANQVASTEKTISSLP